MRKSLYVLTLVAVLAAFSVNAFSQSQPTVTTLSAAIDDRATRMSVASATGFLASNTAAGTDYYAFIDRELVRVSAITGTIITIQRGQSRTSTSGHASGAHVFFGPAAQSQGLIAGQSGGPFISTVMAGSCTRSQWPVLPLIQVNPNALGGQAMYDCNAGTWNKQTLLDEVAQPALYKACTVPIGSVAYASMGTSITASTTAQYTANVYVPQTFLATGITQLNGSAVDTASKKIVILYTADGKLVANSATAGTAATGNDAFQAIAFTATKVVTGPAYYLIGLQDDTADVNGLRMIAASTFNNVVTSSITSVFGTVASSVTAPTTFSADVGPIACMY